MHHIHCHNMKPFRLSPQKEAPMRPRYYKSDSHETSLIQCHCHIHHPSVVIWLIVRPGFIDTDTLDPRHITTSALCPCLHYGSAKMFG